MYSKEPSARYRTADQFGFADGEPADAADVVVAFNRPDGRVGAPYSLVRLAAPFAITSAVPATGGVVRLPAGVFEINEPLRILLPVTGADYSRRGAEVAYEGRPQETRYAQRHVLPEALTFKPDGAVFDVGHDAGGK